MMAVMNQVNDVPLAALGGVDSGKDNILLVQERRPGQVSGGHGRIEGQISQKSGTAGGLLGQKLELVKIPDSHFWLFVTLFEEGRIEAPQTLYLCGERRLQAIGSQLVQQSDQIL